MCVCVCVCVCVCADCFVAGLCQFIAPFPAWCPIERRPITVPLNFSAPFKPASRSLSAIVLKSLPPRLPFPLGQRQHNPVSIESSVVTLSHRRPQHEAVLIAEPDDLDVPENMVGTSSNDFGCCRASSPTGRTATGV